MKNIKNILIIFVLTLMSGIAVNATDVNTILRQRVDLNVDQAIVLPFSLENIDTQAHRYIINYQTLKNQYEVYFTIQDVVTSSVEIPASGHIDLNAHLKLLSQENASWDEMQISALRDDNQQTIQTLSINVLSDFVLNVQSSFNSISSINGGSFDLSISVFNKGSSDLTNVGLDANLPSKWIATETSAKITTLKPNESALINLHIEVPNAQISGLSQMKIKAISTETSSSEVNIDVQVKANANIIYWLIGLLLLVLGFVIFQFKRFGRR